MSLPSNLDDDDVDISEESLECAQRNVNANGLHDRIRLAQTSPFNTLPVELIKQETTRSVSLAFPLGQGSTLLRDTHLPTHPQI